jgi:hypothetical protein
MVKTLPGRPDAGRTAAVTQHKNGQECEQRTTQHTVFALFFQVGCSYSGNPEKLPTRPTLTLIRMKTSSFRLQQALFPADPLHFIGILHRKADLNPLASQPGEEYPVPPRPPDVAGKPGFEVAGSMDSPLAVPDCRFLYRYPDDIGQRHYFILSRREIVLLENDSVLGYRYQPVTVNHGVSHPFAVISKLSRPEP